MVRHTVPWQHGCRFADVPAARAFVRDHRLTSAGRCIEVVRRTMEDADPVKETFLVGLNGFPNSARGRMQPGSTVLFNWVMAYAVAQGLTESDRERVLGEAVSVQRMLRIYGPPERVVQGVLSCLERNRHAVEDLQKQVDAVESGGVRVLDAAKGMRPAVKALAGRSLVHTGGARYSVRRYGTREDLIAYLEGSGRRRVVYVSTSGDLNMIELDALEAKYGMAVRTFSGDAFLEGLRWVIRSRRFQGLEPPFYVYVRHHGS